MTCLSSKKRHSACLVHTWYIYICMWPQPGHTPLQHIHILHGVVVSCRGRREASQATLSMLQCLLERGKLGGAHVRVALVGGADGLVHQIGLEEERREGGRRRHNRVQHPRRTHAADGGWAADALLWSAQSRPGPKPCVPCGPRAPTANTTTELSTCCVCHGRGVVDLGAQLQRGRPTVQRGVPSGAERRGGAQCQCSASAVPV